MKVIPVFFINGFNNSGKSTFILETIKFDEFYKQRHGDTLLLQCEEGIVKYDEEEMKKVYKTSIAKFTSFEEFTVEALNKLIKLHKPDRIVCEMNGDWDLSKIKFPGCMQIRQIISFINGENFKYVFDNQESRQKLNDIISKSQVVCFIKVKNVSEELGSYQVPLKMMNSQAQFFVMDEKNVASVAFEEPLPYDVESETIQIKNEDYGTFYIDTFDHKERYDGKNVEYDIMVVKSSKLPNDTFVAGRMIMNCCANDIQLCGFLCKSSLGIDLKDREWIHLKAKLVNEYSEEYKEDEFVLYPISIEKIPEIKDAVLNLSGN